MSDNLLNDLKNWGDAAHLCGDFELARFLLEVEGTIKDLQKEIEIAQHNATRVETAVVIAVRKSIADALSDNPPEDWRESLADASDALAYEFGGEA